MIIIHIHKNLPWKPKLGKLAKVEHRTFIFYHQAMSLFTIQYIGSCDIQNP